MLTSSPPSSLHSKALSFTRPAPIFQPNPNSQFLHFHRSHHSLAGAPVKRWPSIVAMSKSPKVEEQKFSVEGLVTESLGNGMFRIELDNADTVIGYISGRIRKSFIRVLPGDRVRVEVSRYDTTRGRIVYRLRNAKDSPPS